MGILGELLRPITTNNNHISREVVIKRNCLVLIITGLNLNKTSDQVTAALKEYLGEKNVASVFYPQAKPPLHSGIVNLKCLNATVYKQQLRKSARICSKWIEFQPHSNNLDRSAKRDEETIKRIGFSNVNNALVT